MLEIDNLRKAFGKTKALDGLSLHVERGEMVGVVGRSGAGKSTLLRVINRLIDPSEGTIRVDGRDVAALRGRAVRAWRARCGMIFQQFNLVNRLDVLTNVLAGRLFWQPTWRVLTKSFTVEDRALAAQALDRLGMLTHAFQRAESLSGGQQQRVAIARALVQNPEILLADEPIASLDPMNAALVMETLRRINREDGLTVVCSLHQVDVTLRHCDRIIGLADGRLVFDRATKGLTVADVERVYGFHGAGDDAAQEPGVAEPHKPPLDVRQRPRRAFTTPLLPETG
jgi:phosphonate transport system ATP-binding protein